VQFHFSVRKLEGMGLFTNSLGEHALWQAER